MAGRGTDRVLDSRRDTRVDTSSEISIRRCRCRALLVFPSPDAIVASRRSSNAMSPYFLLLVCNGSGREKRDGSWMFASGGIRFGNANNVDDDCWGRRRRMLRLLPALQHAVARENDELRAIIIAVTTIVVGRR